MGQDVIEKPELKHANGHANGRPLNGKPRGPVKEESDQTNENIFIFIPNLIGEYSNPYSCGCGLQHSRARSV